MIGDANGVYKTREIDGGRWRRPSDSSVHKFLSAREETSLSLTEYRYPLSAAGGR